MSRSSMTKFKPQDCLIRGSGNKIPSPFGGFSFRRHAYNAWLCQPSKLLIHSGPANLARERLR